MGFFWDLIQQSRIEEQKAQADSLEERVDQLEFELKRTKDLLYKTLIELEKHIGADIDGDGKQG